MVVVVWRLGFAVRYMRRGPAGVPPCLEQHVPRPPTRPNAAKSSFLSWFGTLLPPREYDRYYRCGLAGDRRACRLTDDVRCRHHHHYHILAVARSNRHLTHGGRRWVLWLDISSSSSSTPSFSTNACKPTPRKLQLAVQACTNYM